VEVRVLSRVCFFYQRVTGSIPGPVDNLHTLMSRGGDKMVTNAAPGVAKRSKARRSGGSKKQGPFLKVRSGSAAVPVYRSETHGRIRYTLSFYREGRRERKVFTDLEDAKREALFVAQRIQSGMQHVTDLKPHERDSYKAATTMLEKSGIPLVAAVEDYLRARELAGTESLAAMAAEHGRHFKKVQRQVTIPVVVAEMLLQREQDGASKVYLGQLRTTLNRFAAKFPGEILEATSQEIDAWLRSLDVAAGTRNSMLRCIKVFFSFARERNYLPEDRDPRRGEEEQSIPGEPAFREVAFDGLAVFDFRGPALYPDLVNDRLPVAPVTAGQQQDMAHRTAAGQQVEILPDRRQPQGGQQTGICRIREVDDLQAAQLVEVVNRRAVGLPDVGFFGQGRRTTAAFAGRRRGRSEEIGGQAAQRIGSPAVARLEAAPPLIEGGGEFSARPVDGGRDDGAHLGALQGHRSAIDGQR
jgi:hypothetical protein